MRLFTDLKLKFEQANWARNPEFCLLDTIIEQRPDLLDIIKGDLMPNTKKSIFGRKDIPSIEQILRAAIYKELRGLTYRELEYHQIDSRICVQFLKIDELHPYSFQVYHKYISMISAESLGQLMIELNKIAISEGYEDLKKIRQDSTITETDIHYPTNNSLVWDCIKTSYNLLEKLSSELPTVKYNNYIKTAKKTYYKINNTKGNNKKERMQKLFEKQLITFTKTINNLSNAVKKKSSCSLKAHCIIEEIEQFIPVCQQVFSQTENLQIHDIDVPNEEKIFSIYESHTDIIVKGSRQVEFGHKIDFSGGKSNLILDCAVLKGNPSDTSLYTSAIHRIQNAYGKVPESLTADGGYASANNRASALKEGIKNVVFNKISGSLQNIASSKNMETRLKKWRSGIEAVISNIKRGFGLRRITWSGFEHFEAKVFWSVIAYNIRVMTGHCLAKL